MDEVSDPMYKCVSAHVFKRIRLKPADTSGITLPLPLLWKDPNNDFGIESPRRIYKRWRQL
jgi:hypothetical protein